MPPLPRGYVEYSEPLVLSGWCSSKNSGLQQPVDQDRTCGSIERPEPLHLSEGEPQARHLAKFCSCSLYELVKRFVAETRSIERASHPSLHAQPYNAKVTPIEVGKSSEIRETGLTTHFNL